MGYYSRVNTEEFMAYTLDSETHQALVEILEDSVEFFCDEFKISGELAWLATQNLATVKLENFKGNTK